MPTGWNTIQADNPMTRLSTRIPPQTAPDVEMQSPGPWEGSDESASAGSEDRSQPHNAQTRMADDSSEDDSDFPHVRNIHAQKTQGSARGKKKKTALRTYGKKGKKRFEKERAARTRAQSVELPDHDDNLFDGGPLLRLGEGLIIDWHEEAFDAVFGGVYEDEQPNRKTYQNVEQLVDPAAEAKKKQRQLRRKNGITLDDCLAEFEKEEILSENDTWYCPRCKEHRRASKKFDLWKTPDILVVHLKRFSSSGWRRDKLDVLVDFPVEGLDLTERVIDIEHGKQEIYDLIAVDNHWGGLGGGHYTAFARNFVDGEWYEYNDASVSKQKDPERVVGPGAYLLFYRRRSEIPLGGPRFQEIFDRFDNQTTADEDMSDSGEGQRLGLGSSLRGSPSALIGADLTLPRGSRGLGSVHAVAGVDPELPTYEASLVRVGDPNNELDGDTDMGSQQWSQQNTLRDSIEADEAIDLPEFVPTNPAMTTILPAASWSFRSLGQGSEATGGDDDIASDVAQGDNSSDDPFADAGDEMEPMPMLLAEPGSDYVEPPEPQNGYAEYNEPPIPAAQGQNDYMSRLAVEVWGKQVHTVPADLGGDQGSDRVAEIHVGDEPALPEEPRQTPNA